MFMSFSVHVSISDFFTIRQKRIRGEGAFSEVPVRHSNSHYVSATRRLALDNRPTQFNSPSTYTHTWCTLSCTAAGREAGKKRWGMEGWREGS